MEFIGEHLKKSRLKKKIDLETIAKNLNIQIDILKKIENNDFSVHLDLVYLIGHIRAYAKFLGLNDNEVIKKFKDQNLIDKKDLIEELPKPLEIKKFNFYFATKTFTFLFIMSISFGFYFLFVRTNDIYPNYSILPDLPENLQYEIEESEIQSTLKNINKNKYVDIAEEILTSSSIDKSINDSFILNESSVNANTSDDNDQDEFNNIITLKFLEPTWIQLRNNKDKIVFSKLMSSNDEYSYFIVDNFTLTTGNAGNIIVLIDGNQRGKIGKKGEVIDSFVINSDFNN